MVMMIMMMMMMMVMTMMILMTTTRTMMMLTTMIVVSVGERSGWTEDLKGKVNFPRRYGHPSIFIGIFIRRPFVLGFLQGMGHVQ